jgi:hypothetical protein
MTEARDVPVKKMSRKELEDAYKDLRVQYHDLHAKMTVVTESVWMATKVDDGFAKEFALRIVRSLDNPESWWKAKDNIPLQKVIDTVMRTSA